MFRALFFATLFVTLMVNIIFLFATKDKPPDLASTTTLVSVASFQSAGPTGDWQRQSWPPSDTTHGGGRRLFLRSNDFYDYSPPLFGETSQPKPASSSSPEKTAQLESGRALGPSDELGGRRRAEEVNDKSKQQLSAGEAGFGPAWVQPERLPDGEPGSSRGNGGGGGELLASGASLAASSAKQTIGAQGIPLIERAPRWSAQLGSEPGGGGSRLGTGVAQAEKHVDLNTNEMKTGQKTTTTTALTSTRVDNDNYNRSDKDAAGSGRVSGNLVEADGGPAGHVAGANDANGANSPPARERVVANEIVATRSSTMTIRVKSSKNHVLVRVDDSLIYESGSGGEPRVVGDRPRQQQQQQQHQLSVSAGVPRGRHKRQRRAWAHRHQSISGGLLVGVQDKNRTAASGQSESTIKQQQDDQRQEEQQQQQQHVAESERELAEASRGIHVVVLNQFDGSLMSRRVFDTYTPQQDDELQLYLNQIQDGRVLVFAVKDEASFRMARGSAARKLLRRLGSRHIGSLGWRDMWAMVTVKRLGSLLETNGHIGERVFPTSQVNDHDKCLAEAVSHSASFSSWAEPVHIEAQVQLAAPSDSERQLNCFADSNDQARQRRRDFCSRIEGYGRVCDCKHPSQIEFEPRAPPDSGAGGQWQLGAVPIVVIASNRPYYLYRMLKSLLGAAGVNASLITVFIDGFYDEPAQVCKLFNLRYIQHKPTGRRSARISNHYKTSLAFTFRRLFGESAPPPTHAIVFEEDLDVAPDALLYFNQTIGLLRSDPSLYCVSAWNDQGYEHSVGNLRRLYRIETMPGLGWMLSRDLFIDELEPAWPSASQQHDWDMWIRTRPVRKGRECLIPDVSRTYHFGSSGTNINSYFQRQYFSKHAFSAHHLRDASHASGIDGQHRKSALTTNAGQWFQFEDLDKMDKTNYELMIERLLGEQAEFVGYNQSSSRDQSGGSVLSDQQRQYKFLCSLANLTHYRLDEESNQEDASNSVKQANDIGEPVNASAGVVIRSAATANNNTSTTIKVIFIKMIDRDDYGNWLKLAKCWHLWDLDARGQHQSAWRLYLNSQPTLVVGDPASPYSKFKPDNLVPFDF